MQTKSTDNLFENQSFYVGIDYHKKSWKVTILGEQYEHKTMSQDPNPAILAAYLKKHFPGGTYKAIYEAGFSGFTACRKLNELGIDCKVIHPADVPTNQKERLQKTDKADSRKLAKMLRADQFVSVHIPEQKLEADRSLIRQRFKIAKDVARTKNRIKSLLFQFGINIPERFSPEQTRHWSRVYIDWLKQVPVGHETLRKSIDNYIEIGLLQRQELLKVTNQIRTLSKTDAYKENVEILISIPGIGLITAMTLLTEIGDIKRFGRIDELCSFIGLVPSMHNSGESERTGKMIRRGRKELKIMLIEASWVAIRKDPAMMLRFNELAKRMNKNKAIIRIARKMLSRLRHLLINKQKYELSIY